MNMTMNMTMNKALEDLTIEQVSAAADINTEKYIPRAKGIAKQAFIEGVVWAQKVQRENRIL